MPKNHTKQIMTHLVAGYPTVTESLKLAEVLCSSGADILEIQIPFSEPVADGPTIVEACHVALKNGFKTDQIFDFCKRLSKFKVPLYVMSYANPILHSGIAKFCRKLKEAGVTGIIIPDLPFDSDEGIALREESKKNAIHLVQVVSPSMQMERLSESVRLSSHMIYCTSKSGTTGGSTVISSDLRTMADRIKKISDLHVAVGFGISSKQDVRNIQKIADVAVIGSAIIRKFKEFSGAKRFAEVKKFVSGLHY